MQRPWPSVAVKVPQVLDPAIDPRRAVLVCAFQAVLRTQGQQALVLREQRRHPPLLEDQHEVPVVLLAGVQHRAAGEQAVPGDHQAGLRERLLQLRRQPRERLELAVLFDLFGAPEIHRAGLFVLDALRGNRQHDAGGAEQLGLQHLVQIQRGFAVPLHQAMLAVPAVEAQHAGAVDRDHPTPQQAGGVEDLHAHQAFDHVHVEAGPGRDRDAAEEVIEGVVDGPGGLRGLGQAVEVVQDVGVAGLEIEVELAARAELEEVQGDAPPGQEAAVVLDGVGVAGVGELIEPVVEAGEEVADGQGQGGAEVYKRPRWRRRWGTWLLIRARVRSVISLRRRLRRRCSVIHWRTSASSSLGT